MKNEKKSYKSLTSSILITLITDKYVNVGSKHNFLKTLAFILYIREDMEHYTSKE